MTELDVIDIFGNNLESILCEKNISQNRLAKEMNLDKSTISRYINKERLPTMKSFINLCVVLECDPYELLPFYDKVE